MHIAHITKHTKLDSQNRVKRTFAWECSCGIQNSSFSSYGQCEAAMDQHLLKHRRPQPPHETRTEQKHNFGRNLRRVKCKILKHEDDDLIRQSLEQACIIEIPNLNVVRFALYQYDHSGGFFWECGCGASGQSAGDTSKQDAAIRAVNHIKRIHRKLKREGFLDPPVASHTREDPVSVPIASPTTHPTDDAQSHDPNAERASQDPKNDAPVRTSCAPGGIRTLTSRWDLFNDIELTTIRAGLTHLREIELCNEITRALQQRPPQ